MSAISLATAQAQLAAWLAADTAVAGGQAYQIGNRSFTRANAAEITAKIQFWEQKVNQLQNAAQNGGNGGIRVRYGTFGG